MKKSTKGAVKPEDPAAKMIDFTRHLLNVSKAEIDGLRRKRKAAKKPRK